MVNASGELTLFDEHVVLYVRCFALTVPRYSGKEPTHSTDVEDSRLEWWL